METEVKIELKVGVGAGFGVGVFERTRKIDIKKPMFLVGAFKKVLVSSLTIRLIGKEF